MVAIKARTAELDMWVRASARTLKNDHDPDMSPKDRHFGRVTRHSSCVRVEARTHMFCRWIV